MSLTQTPMLALTYFCCSYIEKGATVLYQPMTACATLYLRLYGDQPFPHNPKLIANPNRHCFGQCKSIKQYIIWDGGIAQVTTYLAMTNHWCKGLQITPIMLFLERLQNTRPFSKTL